MVGDCAPDKASRDAYVDDLVGIMCYKLLPRTVTLSVLKLYIYAGYEVNSIYESYE